MPSFKPDLRITVQIGEASFSIGGLLLPDGRYLIKRGRVISKKMPRASLTKIFEVARKWAVNQRNMAR
jgi:hypothetical protein